VSGNLFSGVCNRGASCEIDDLPQLTAIGQCPLPPTLLLSGDSCQPVCNFDNGAPPGSTTGMIFCDNGEVEYPSPDGCLCELVGEACVDSAECCLTEICSAEGFCSGDCTQIGGTCEVTTECCGSEICAVGICGTQ
jgi:hypothetical protein